MGMSPGRRARRHRGRGGRAAGGRLEHRDARGAGLRPAAGRRPRPAERHHRGRGRRARVGPRRAPPPHPVRHLDRGPLTGVPAGRPARLLDVVEGRTGAVYASWLAERDQPWRDRIRLAALDPFRGYATALATQLPQATRVLDCFHVVKLGNQMVDESAGCCAAAPSTSPTARAPDSARRWPPATPTAKSRWPGSSPRPWARATAAPSSPTGNNRPKPYSTPCTPAPTPKPHASAAPWPRGAPNCWPTSTPTGPPTAPPKR